MKIILELSIEKSTQFIAVWPGKANSCFFILCEYYHTIYFLELCMHPFYGDKNDAYFGKRTLQFTSSKCLFRCRSKLGSGKCGLYSNQGIQHGRNQSNTEKSVHVIFQSFVIGIHS